MQCHTTILSVCTDISLNVDYFDVDGAVRPDEKERTWKRHHRLKTFEYCQNTIQPRFNKSTKHLKQRAAAYYTANHYKFIPCLLIALLLFLEV